MDIAPQPSPVSGSDSAAHQVVKFLPFSSTVDSPFWVRYCRLKLETIRLQENSIIIRAYYEAGGDVKNVARGDDASKFDSINRVQLQEASFDAEVNNDSHNATSQPPFAAITSTGGDARNMHRIACQGTLLGYNTIETFQKVDKNDLLKSIFCQQFFDKRDETIVLQSLNSFVLLTFADLKQHKVLYWFGFPAFLTKAPIIATPIETIEEKSSLLSWRNVAQGLREYIDINHRIPTFFVLPSSLFVTDEINKGKEEQTSSPLLVNLSSNYQQELNLPQDQSEATVVFGFVDPTCSNLSEDKDDDDPTSPVVGWPMRNLIAYLVLHLGMGGKTVFILSLRLGAKGGFLSSMRATALQVNRLQDSIITGAEVGKLIESSTLLKTFLPRAEDYDYSDTSMRDTQQHSPEYKVVGWELNSRQKPGPRWVNLRPLLDQRHLAVQAADLNLKLMKWRMIPQLDVEMLQGTKVLLLGAGTLGCSVARTLLGWGIRQFKFVDYGTVSYSNPVRQNLFTLDDCHYNHGQGRLKAQAAADALKAVAADVVSEGIFLSIPMPGHAAETSKADGNDSYTSSSLKNTVEELDALIQESDVVFLLTDTRESRWLPTLMAAAHDKIMINAALGLDSWLVMRHGGGHQEIDDDKRLGCYFCNDVVAPENSTKNRTLDQQCTVTRPGLAPIASSMAVELFVSLLHHSNKQRAPAPPQSSLQKSFSPTESHVDSESSSPLGVIPHQIRGSLVTYTMMTPTIPAFRCCTGCSPSIINVYRRDKLDLVSRVCASMDGCYLEDLSGLTAFRAQVSDDLSGLEEDWEEDE